MKLTQADDLMDYPDELLDVVKNSDGHADDIIKAVSTYGDDAADAITKYGDDAADIIAKHGEDGLSWIKKYEKDALDVIGKYGDEAVDSLKKGMTPDEIRAYKTISEADRIKINNWINTPSDELYIKYKDVFDNPKYYNQETGEIYWPVNDGFASVPVDEVLEPGTRIDRYGSDYGSFTSPEGIPYEMRAVAPGTHLKPYSVFEVVEPIKVKAGEIAPWFDEPGGGIQYLLPDTVDALLEEGVLRRIE